MQSTMDKLLSALLTLAAVAVAGTLLHREFFAATPGGRENAKAAYMKDWRTLLPASHTTGGLQAPVMIVEMSDLECPFCKSFHKNVKALQDKYPDRVSLSYVHFPIPGHKQALRAARAFGMRGQGWSVYDCDRCHLRKPGLAREPRLAVVRKGSRWREHRSAYSLHVGYDHPPDGAVWASAWRKNQGEWYSDGIPKRLAIRWHAV